MLPFRHVIQICKLVLFLAGRPVLVTMCWCYHHEFTFAASQPKGTATLMGSKSGAAGDLDATFRLS